MSCNYADGLSPYHDKGQLGLVERFDNNSVITVKVDMLAKWINKANHVVVHTGAGISTSAGIPDFRGPKGVWTLQAKGQKPDLSTDFNEAIPTPTHMAIARLVETTKVKYVISQNIDGLHLRSGLPRKFLSELHGNMFIEQCNACNRQFVRNTAVPTVGQKNLNKACPTIKPNGRACRGRLHDTILDWEHSLPENDLAMGDFHSCLADLSIALGTTMQIVPSGSLPLYTKKAGGKLVIINLQPTKHDTKADLLIHGYADEVMAMLMKQLSLRIPKYSSKNDPTRLALSSDRYFEWTISDAATAHMRRVYEAKCGTKEAKKRLEAIDDDDVPLMNRIKANWDSSVKVSRKRKGDESSVTKSKSRRDQDDDSDLEVVEEIPKRGRGRPPKKDIPTSLPPTKLTIKKNVTPNKTKYEIVPSRSERRPKRNVEIIHEDESNAIADLEMVCESDDDAPVSFTTNFRRYLHDDKTFKREEKVNGDVELSATVVTSTSDVKDEEEKKQETPAGDFKVEKANKEETTAKEEVEGTPAEQMDTTDGSTDVPEQKPTCESAAAAVEKIQNKPAEQLAGEGESGVTPGQEDGAATSDGVPDGSSDGAPVEAEAAVLAEIPEPPADIHMAPRSPIPGEMPADAAAVPDLADAMSEPLACSQVREEGAGWVTAGNDGNNNSNVSVVADERQRSAVDMQEGIDAFETHSERSCSQPRPEEATTFEASSSGVITQETSGGNITADSDVACTPLPSNVSTAVDVSGELASSMEFEINSQESAAISSVAEKLPESGSNSDCGAVTMETSSTDSIVSDLDLLCSRLPV